MVINLIGPQRPSGIDLSKRKIMILEHHRTMTMQFAACTSSDITIRNAAKILAEISVKTDIRPSKNQLGQ